MYKKQKAVNYSLRMSSEKENFLFIIHNVDCWLKHFNLFVDVISICEIWNFLLKTNKMLFWIKYTNIMCLWYISSVCQRLDFSKCTLQHFEDTYIFMEILKGFLKENTWILVFVKGKLKIIHIWTSRFLIQDRNIF